MSTVTVPALPALPALPPLVAPGAELTRAEVERYSRHLLLPEVGALGQRRLKNAKVLVVGAGGLGAPALLYLAAAGVGTLGVVDPDVVETSNLQRQVIHGVSDVGTAKVLSARASIAEVNPLVQVQVHEVLLDADNALDVLRGYDLVVDGTDNFATRYLVNDAAVLLGMPHVWGSIFRFEGQVSVFWDAAPDGRGLSYRDVYPSAPPAGTVPSCAEGGVLGVLCASIGSVMGTEVLKLLLGIGEPLLGRLLVHDALAMTYRTVRVRRDPSAPAVTTLRPALAVSPVPQLPDAEGIGARELAELLASASPPLLVDVREPGEREIVHIPGSRLVPNARILSGEALAELPRDRPIVLHCRSGARSAQALAVLRRAGFTDAEHLRGGVLAWVAEVDPSLPTY